MTSPPMTAVRRVDFLRQIDTSRGDNKYDTARFVAPIHAEKNEKDKEFIVIFCKNNMILALHCDTNIHQKSALCIMICSKQEGHHQKRVITCLDMF